MPSAGLPKTMGARTRLTLRQAAFSDGVPFTAEDVLFSFEAVYDERVHSPLKKALEVDGQPLAVSSARPVDDRHPLSRPLRAGFTAAR